MGRKKALTRALAALFPSFDDNQELSVEAIQMNKRLREEVWKGYHSRWVNDAFQQVEANTQQLALGQ